MYRIKLLKRFEYAVINNEPSLVEVFLKGMPDLLRYKKMGISRSHGVSFSHLANHPVIIQLLLDYGADLSDLDLTETLLREIPEFLEYERVGANRGDTLLHLAKHPTIIRLLLEAGEDPRALNNLKRTPLHLVKNPEIAELLLKAGVPVNARDYLGKTVLHYVGQNIEIVKLLFKYGADPKIKDEFGNTPAISKMTSIQYLKNECARIFNLKK